MILTEYHERFEMKMPYNTHVLFYDLLVMFPIFIHSDSYMISVIWILLRNFIN